MTNGPRVTKEKFTEILGEFGYKMGEIDHIWKTIPGNHKILDSEEALRSHCWLRKVDRILASSAE